MISNAPTWIRRSTAGLPRHQRPEIWQETCGALYDVSFDEPDTDYALNQVTFACNDLVLSHFKFTPARLVRTPQLIRRWDLPDLLQVPLVLSGQNQGRAGGEDYTGTGGSILVMDMARPVEQSFQGETAIFYVERDRLARLLPGAATLHGAVPTTPLAGLFKDHMLSAIRQTSAITMDTAPAILDSLIRLLSVAIAPHPDVIAEAKIELNAALLRRAKAFIQRELLSPDLSPDWIARNVGVSRRKLYYLFEPDGGVAHFVQCARLERARAALVDRRRPYRVKEAAFDFGFTSEAHFSRSFKRLFGFSPREAAEVSSSH